MHHPDTMELRKIRRLLQSLLEIAEESSLTGVFSGGAESAVRRYNAILEHLEDHGHLPDDVFEPLPTDQTGFDRLGIEIKLLLGYLEEDGHGEPHRDRAKGAEWLIGIAPFVDRDELTKMVEDQISKGVRIHEGALIALAPFMERRSLGKLLNRILSGEAPEPPEAPEAPEPPETPEAPEPPEEPRAPKAVVVQDEAAAQLQRLSAELANPDLSADRRAEIAMELGELAHRQALEARGE